MTTTNETDKVRAFITRYNGIRILSTGAQLVDFTGVLYNVTGSTDDPRRVDGHTGVSWKKLLNKYENFSEASCYVTSPLPAITSTHPDFLVGGHMTTNSSGVVELGGVTYLMPLCKWHNSTSQNGVAFEHLETRMLKLTGFMEGDTSITFDLRLDNQSQYTQLYFDKPNKNWVYREISGMEGQTILEQSLRPMSGGHLRQEHALFEKQGDYFFIKAANISNDSDNRI